MEFKNLTQEDVNFIKELAYQLKNQDTRGTASPCGFVLTQRVVRRVENGFGDEVWCYWNDEEYHADEFNRFLEDIEDYYGENSEVYIKFKKAGNFKEIYNSFELQDLIEEIEMDIYEVAFNDEVDLSNFNFFLTEKAANEYIEKDKHNLFMPKTFCAYLKKNDEMAKIINLFKKMADELE